MLNTYKLYLMKLYFRYLLTISIIFVCLILILNIIEEIKFFEDLNLSIFYPIIFTFLLIGTSIIKNQTREIEKKIYNISNKIFLKEKDLNESQLDFFYLTSPSIIERKIEHLDYNHYFPMEYSNIFLSMNNFLGLK